MFNLFSRDNDKVDIIKPIRLHDFTNPQPIADYFLNKTGVSFDKQPSILNSKLSSFCFLHGIVSFEECLLKVKSCDLLEQELVDYLTTNETYFYREFKQIEDLVTDVYTQARNVKILCAPCSTGEEPYSIAIALIEAGVAADKFSIVGIDISNTALSKAESAQYRERNVSKMPAQLVTKYFKKEASKYQLETSIKNQVTFKKFNLFDSNIGSLGKFDYVMSRNMLIYFNPPTKEKATEILQSLLIDQTQAVLYGHADLY